MKIGVLSTGPSLYSTQRLVEAARERGHDVRVINHTKCIMTMEKNVPSVIYKGEKLTDINAVIPRIGASVTFFGTAVVRQFEMMKVFSAVESQAIVRSRDKLRSMQILAREGIGVPKSAFAKFPKDQDVEAVMEEVGKAPLIIKLLEGTQGTGVVLAETNKAAKSVIEAFAGLKENFIIQEFVKESGGADIRVFVVDGHVVGAMKRQGKEGEFRSNLHKGGKGTVIELSKRERSAAIKSAKALGLAIAGVDMLQSKRGPLILEVNSSPGLEGIEKSTGKDIAGKIIAYLERKVVNKKVTKVSTRDRVKG